MVDVSPDLQRALAELGKHQKLLAEDPDAWFFEVTNPLEDLKVPVLVRDVVNMVASHIVEASR